MRKLTIPPKAASLSRSMRDIGYSLETAIADIIDNSITASASKIEILFNFDSADPVLAILDNGIGMTENKLISAMQHGSDNTLRPDEDLGRFGLGLKTASFSQCTHLTVISRKDGIYTGAVWDLEIINKQNDWILCVLDEEDIGQVPYLEKLDTNGTLVVWRNLDRLCEITQNIGRDNILKKIDVAEKHLAMVFHRFLSGEIKKKKISILMNGKRIIPFDPFCLDHMATQQLPEEIIRIDGKQIRIQPFILPHHSKLSPKELEYYKTRSEFVSNQGAYIYRNGRLMAWGNWFRLLPKNELTKLARVRIDFPSTLDNYWVIDIKKSRAQPPQQIRERLSQIVGKIATSSSRVHTGRGRKLHEQKSWPLWVRHAEREGVNYSLNREHPLLVSFEESLDTTYQKLFSALLSVVEQSIPVELIYSDYSSNPKDFEEYEKIDSSEIKARMEVLFEMLTTHQILSAEGFKEIISKLKPFCYYRQEIDDLIMEKFHD